MINFSDQESMLKIDSIVKKWKPGPIVAKKFAPSDLQKYKPKRYSMKEVRAAPELPLETPRDLLKSSSVSQSPKKRQNSEIINKK